MSERSMVRYASIDDLDRLVPLFDAYRQFYQQPSDAARARAFLQERFERGESSVLLALDQRGNGVGFCQLYPLFSSVRTARLWLLNDLYVDATARRAGVARALLAAAADHGRATGAVGLSLSTALDNHAAQALYASMGWQRDSAFCEYTLTL